MILLDSIIGLIPTDSVMSISDLADIANIIVAIVNLFLAGYIFIYQRNKDAQADVSQAEITAKSIRLQWFKELIVQPNLVQIDNFYKKLHSLESPISLTNLPDIVKYSISEQIKAEASLLRIVFVDSLHAVNSSLHTSVKNNIDNLVDSLTNSIFDGSIDLGDKQIREAYITNKIKYSHNDLIRVIYNYQGG